MADDMRARFAARFAAAEARARKARDEQEEFERRRQHLKLLFDSGVLAKLDAAVHELNSSLGDHASFEVEPVTGSSPPRATVRLFVPGANKGTLNVAMGHDATVKFDSRSPGAPELMEKAESLEHAAILDMLECFAVKALKLAD